MSLNIKNQRVHDLARTAAAATGRTQTGAIEEALELLLAQYGKDAAHAALDSRRTKAAAIIKRFNGRPNDGPLAVRTIDELFDESGLPR
jgi:antitoxin VapB